MPRDQNEIPSRYISNQVTDFKLNYDEDLVELHRRLEQWDEDHRYLTSFNLTWPLVSPAVKSDNELKDLRVKFTRKGYILPGYDVSAEFQT